MQVVGTFHLGWLACDQFSKSHQLFSFVKGQGDQAGLPPSHSQQYRPNKEPSDYLFVAPDDEPMTKEKWTTPTLPSGWKHFPGTPPVPPPGWGAYNTNSGPMTRGNYDPVIIMHKHKKKISRHRR
ncbi:hypothetical protein O181_066953 [Austropuccinia psidii MF-1]|uniref:Uncharacterized protein n=1 Tax=Austropuccinia psidii MF-1 TaxID=1389203 RepID=A0A9Q3ESE9_9BASI|nr:hypothetical protein [Austropuccinia psidii MF-1]